MTNKAVIRRGGGTRMLTTTRHNDMADDVQGGGRAENVTRCGGRRFQLAMTIYSP